MTGLHGSSAEPVKPSPVKKMHHPVPQVLTDGNGGSGRRGGGVAHMQRPRGVRKQKIVNQVSVFHDRLGPDTRGAGKQIRQGQRWAVFSDARQIPGFPSAR